MFTHKTAGEDLKTRSYVTSLDSVSVLDQGFRSKSNSAGLRLMGNVVFLAGCQASEMKLMVITNVAMEDLHE